MSIFDCPVTLKVISEKYLANQLARLRFLREARAMRASVIPTSPPSSTLGGEGGITFTQWSLWLGETLESLMKRSGRLEAKFALEIAGSGRSWFDCGPQAKFSFTETSNQATSW